MDYTFNIYLNIIFLNYKYETILILYNYLSLPLYGFEGKSAILNDIALSEAAMWRRKLITCTITIIFRLESREWEQEREEGEVG